MQQSLQFLFLCLAIKKTFIEIVRLFTYFRAMVKEIDNIRKTRNYILQSIETLSIEQLNKIPQGFNNNIIWNVGHLTAAQQGVCYTRAGVKPVVDEQYLAPFRPGTKPERLFDDGEVKTIKEILLSSLDLLEADYNSNIFSNYTTWTTRYGVTLSSIEDAIKFLNFHEGLHAGYIASLKKLTVQ